MIADFRLLIEAARRQSTTPDQSTIGNQQSAIPMIQ